VRIGVISLQTISVKEDALLFVWISASYQSDARNAIAGIIRQVRNIGGYERKIASAHPHMLAKTLTVPHASLAGHYIDRTFMVFMQMGFGTAARGDCNDV
jgi:hypothetical protein